MALPNIFAAQTQSTGAQLDQNFAALGRLTPVPGVIVGTNALTLTPAANTPAVSALSNYMMFVGVAVATNTNVTTLQIGALAPLGIYKDTESGPTSLVGGEIVTGNAYGFIYDAALAGGVGGFHLVNLAAALPRQATITFGNTAAQAVNDQNIAFSSAKVNGMVWIGPPTSVLAGVMYMGYVPAAGTVTVRAANITAASLTPTGGVFRIGVY